MKGRLIDRDADLDVVHDRIGLRSGLIGAAWKSKPYWELDRDGLPWARLILLFHDEQLAIDSVERRMREDDPILLAHNPRRQIRDVEFSPEAEGVHINDVDLSWALRKLTDRGQRAPAPASLARLDFDVARVRHDGYSSDLLELVVVTEQAIEEELVRCQPRREVVLKAA